MIDLHSHIVPGLDDGPSDVAVSLEMARVAVTDGVRSIVSTPHVNELYTDTPAQVGPAVEELNAALQEEGIGLEVLQGGEVAITRVLALENEQLRGLCLGPQESWILLESPYGYVTDILERTVFDLQTRGFRVLLAHPERSPCFGRGPERLTSLVERGVACSITAGSLEGRFGRQVKRLSLEMLELGLVHNVASDSHDPFTRAPVLTPGLQALDEELEVDDGYADWLTDAVPAAIVAGQPLPLADPPRRRRRGPMSRLRRR